MGDLQAAMHDLQDRLLGCEEENRKLVEDNKELLSIAKQDNSDLMKIRETYQEKESANQEIIKKLRYSCDK